MVLQYSIEKFNGPCAFGKLKASTRSNSGSMNKPIRQSIGIDLTSLISLIWLVIIVGILFWFYNTIKRIEHTLLDIKRLLDEKSQAKT